MGRENTCVQFPNAFFMSMERVMRLVEKSIWLLAVTVSVEFAAGIQISALPRLVVQRPVPVEVSPCAYSQDGHVPRPAT